MQLSKRLFIRDGWSFDSDRYTTKHTFEGRIDTLTIYYNSMYPSGERVDTWFLCNRNRTDGMVISTTEQLLIAAKQMQYEDAIINELQEINNNN